MNPDQQLHWPLEQMKISIFSNQQLKVAMNAYIYPYTMTELPKQHPNGYIGPWHKQIHHFFYQQSKGTSLLLKCIQLS